MPTPEQLAQVKRNVDKLMDLSNHTHDFMQDVLQEVYLELSQDGEPDPGQKFLTTFFTAVFTSIALIEFPGAGLFGTFLGTFFGAYGGDTPPPSLRGAFGSLWQRMDETYLQADKDLAAISDNPAAYWDKSYTDPLTNKSMPVSSLGDPEANMPDRHSALFQNITDAIIAQARITITAAYIGKKFYIQAVTHSPVDPFMLGWTEADFAKFASDTIARQKFSYFASRESFETDCCDGNKKFWGIQYTQFGLTTSSAWASDKLCDWLFRDDQFGKVTNPDGVASRVTVFTEWGIPGTALIQNWPGSVWAVQEPTQETRDSIQAVAWAKLFDGVTRQELEKRLIRKFYADPAFAKALLKEPGKTIAAELGVELPSFAKVEVLRETRGSYKLLIPAAGLDSYLADD
ncbi:hypothetical protein ACEN9F_03810 [Duganella sp. CT11-25]|uniref:hypothetical protein n=1 Tax=unclassified Duganella TaxID=2636909 RepID=UPI0039B08044